MARLKYSVHVRDTKPVDAKKPELGETVVRQEFFTAGDELPEWAQKLVGDHVYEDGEAPSSEAEKPSGRGASKSDES